MRSIDDQLLQVLFIPLPTDVNRKPISDQHVPVRRRRGAARRRGSRYAPHTPLGRASAISVGAGVDWIPQHPCERVAIRPVPFELARGRSRANAKRQPDIMRDQVAQQSIERRRPRENSKIRWIVACTCASGSSIMSSDGGDARNKWKASAPRCALARRPSSMRTLRMCSSASDMVWCL
jgi:hypothetical protein